MKRTAYVQMGLLVLGMAVVTGCGGKQSSGSKAEPPAKVANAVKETDLTTLTLTPEAVLRLGIETVKAEVRAVPRVLKLGGEVIARPGNEAVVAAPAAGVVLAPRNGPPLLPGAHVSRGQIILRLLPLPPDKDLVGARNDLEAKQKQFEAAQAKARRTAQLLEDKAASEKANEEAQAELAVAEGALKGARARWQLLNGGPTDAAADDLSTLNLVSPVDGVIQKREVASGQTVPAGAILFEVASLDPVWVRVPVYVGDVASVEPKAPAEIEVFGTPPGAKPASARPVQGPSLSDAGAVSADLFYELANGSGQFRIGQKVGARLVLSESAEGLVVPWSAVLFDMQGGAWLYVRTAPTVFSRVRIELSHVVGGLAVLRRGPAAGSDVVSSGAAELFGTEFGAGK
jgi:RND family efflux transporter MFP subunit